MWRTIVATKQQQQQRTIIVPCVCGASDDVLECYFWDTFCVYHPPLPVRVRPSPLLVWYNGYRRVFSSSVGRATVRAQRLVCAAGRVFSVSVFWEMYFRFSPARHTGVF